MFSPVPTPSTIEGGRRLGHDARMESEQGCRHARDQSHSLGGFGHRPDRGEGEAGGRFVVDPGMKVLGDDHRVESRRFGLDGLLDELLGMPLLMTTEVGELGQASPFSQRGAILAVSLIRHVDGNRRPVDGVSG